MNTEEKESIKNEIMIEVNEKIQSLKDIITIKNAEQDEKINKLCYISETQSRNLDKVLSFMEEVNNKPNALVDNIKYMFIGAFISIGASFFMEFLKNKFGG